LHWYQCTVNCILVPINEIQATNRIHETQTTDTYYLAGGSDTYTTTQGPFDSYGFVLGSNESNSFSGNQRAITRTYLHDTTNGLLGLPLTEVVNGTTAVQHHYNSLGQLDWT